MKKNITTSSKEEIKQMTNQFMKQYQKQLTEKEFQKQKIKQNIMLEIMSNRQKNQSSKSSTVKDTSQEDRGSKRQNLPQIQREINSRIGQLKIPSQKNSRRSNRQQNLVKSQSQPNNDTDMHDLDNMDNNNNHDEIPGEITFNEKKIKDNQQLLAGFNFKHQPINKYITFGDSRKIVGNQINSQEIPQILESHHFGSNINPNITEEQHSESQNDQEDDKGNKGVFLTMQQHQEEQQSENNSNHNIKDNSINNNCKNQPKNYAFDIVMDKSDPIENIEDLKRKKILELDKKRNQRLEQLKKQEDAKKANMYGRRSQRDNDIAKVGPLLEKNKGNQPKTIEKLAKNNHSAHDLAPEPAPYIIIKNESKHPIRISHHLDQDKDRQQKKLSPFLNTPKTGYSVKNKIPKSTNNIFAESPNRDKSATRYNQDPKIQPKDRKNTFNKQSNQKLMITAITYVCLPGQLNRKERQKLIEVIQSQPCQFFIFLFKEYSRKVIKGIYVMDPLQSRVRKIYGQKAPNQLFSQQVHEFYRFDSGCRQFKKLDGCKSFSLAVHAVDLK